MADFDLPLAKRYLDIMMAGALSGADPDVQALAVIEEFNELYPRRTDAREAILIAAHVERMLDAMPAAPPSQAG
jgi:outer membrane protein assembly factor BamD (BamD/ComL family)